MPPARRPPTGKPTVVGAPVDPAIISMQMAGSTTEEVEKLPAAKEVQDGAEASAPKPALPSDADKEALKPFSAGKEASSASRQLAPIKTSKVGESATANVETELLDSFKQFANMEKMKVHDQRRQRVTHDKAIKYNDLMKFAKNFKLQTPVPKDLIPILAKDKAKQEEIIEKAQRNAESSTTSGLAVTTTSTEPKVPKPAGEGERPAAEVSNSRQIVAPQGPQAAQSGREKPQQLLNGAAASKAGQGLLSHRLADSHRQHRSGVPPVSIPQPLPIQSVSKAARAPVNHNQNQAPGVPVRTPTSASSASAKFNVRAMEFRPNPAANAFRPPGEPSATSSPRSTPHARSASRPATPSAFFGNRKPLPRAERESITAHFDPLKRLKEKAQQDGKSHADNGGIRHAYTTPPTWNTVGPEEEYKSYKQMFDVAATASLRASPQHGSPGHPPHQHQLPMHLQQGHGIPHIPAQHHQQQGSFQPQSQAPHFPQGPHHYDDHRMHPSASSSSIYPSPRMQSASMAYQSPMPQPALAYSQPMPQYFMGPNGPQPAHFARPFPGGPHMIPSQGAPLAAPMMVQQSSQGGYMSPNGITLPFNPQMQVYPPGQPTGFNGPSQPSSNYPSPNRGAPMMMHQGSHQSSHQGQHSQVYMNPGQYTQPVYAQQQPPHSKLIVKSPGPS